MDEFHYKLGTIASLIGDRSRSVMLWSLMDGRAYTATELSLLAEVSPQSASSHLAKLVEAGILAVTKQGRHRYYSYATSNAAVVMESIANLLPRNASNTAVVEQDRGGITFARTCYDHIAGKVGVAITAAMTDRRIIRPAGGEFVVTKQGREWFESAGMDTEEIRLEKRAFARRCLDWSERKPHLAGALGAALLRKMLKEKWVRKVGDSRELMLTPGGRAQLKTLLSVDL